jgi:HEAT repeat protein
MIFNFLKKTTIDNTRKIPSYDYIGMLNKYESTKELNLVLDLFWGLLSDDKTIKRKSFEAINDALSNVNKMRLISLDKQFRSRNSIDWSYDWKTENIRSLLLEDIPVEEQLYVIGLASFHTNGYFREKALRELIRYNNDIVIPFIIIRLNDWVPSIRTVADNYLIRMISEKNFKLIFSNFHLFKHTLNYSRKETNCLFSKIETLINDTSTIIRIMDDITEYDDLAREFIYKITYEKNLLPIEELLDYILNDRINLVRSRIFGKIVRDIPYELILKNKDRILSDTAYKVRVICITELFGHGFYKYPNELFFTLLDNYKSVREIGRFYLNKLGYDKFSEFYTMKINEDNDNSTAMIGLSEVATSEDYSMLIKNLNSNKVLVVRKTLKAMALIDMSSSLDYLYDALKDNRIGVTNEARRILVNSKGLFDDVEVYNIFKVTISSLIKRIQQLYYVV